MILFIAIVEAVAITLLLWERAWFIRELSKIHGQLCDLVVFHIEQRGKYVWESLKSTEHHFLAQAYEHVRRMLDK